MALAKDLPVIGGLALIGAGAGLYLGSTAIGEINPLYFAKMDTASSFHADLVPNRSYDQGPNMPPIEQADSLALGSGCIGCRTYPVDYRPTPDPAIEQVYAPEQERTVSAPMEFAAADGVETSEQAARRKADLERVELYSRAPVTVEEAAVEVASAEVAEPAN